MKTVPCSWCHARMIQHRLFSMLTCVSYLLNGMTMVRCLLSLVIKHQEIKHIILFISIRHGEKFVLNERSHNSTVVFFFLFKHLRSLKVTGRLISDCAWEAHSLRLVIAIDNFIYFANCRLDYKVKKQKLILIIFRNKKNSRLVVLHSRDCCLFILYLHSARTYRCFLEYKNEWSEIFFKIWTKKKPMSFVNW